MNHTAKPIVFITDAGGCILQTSHKLNKDGYFFKHWGTGPDKVAEMFHRFLWRALKGPIPEGYDIDHLCRNRGCQNVTHMRCLPHVDHAVATNDHHHGVLRTAAKDHWMATECGAEELAALFKVHRVSAFRWLRKWRTS